MRRWRSRAVAGQFPGAAWTHGLLALWWYPFLLWAVATPVQLWSGWSFYTAGWAGIRRLQPNMHTLIGLGTSVAYGYSVAVVLMTLLAPGALAASPGAHQLHFDMAAIIVALILLGRWLEARACPARPAQSNGCWTCGPKRPTSWPRTAL